MEGPKGVEGERLLESILRERRRKRSLEEATGESEMPGAIWRAALALALLAPAAALYATDTASLIPARQSPSQVLLPPPPAHTSPSPLARARVD